MKQNKNITQKRNASGGKARNPINLKSILAILLILLLVGMAIAPVFSETVPNLQSASNTLTVDVTGAEDSNKDEEYKDYVDFMIDFVTDSYYKPVDRQTLIEGAYKGVFEVLDPHSMYFNPTEFAEFNTDMEGEFTGIGAVIADGEHYVEIVSPIKGTPAFEAGLLPGDRIASVDGMDAKEWTKERAVKNIRGAEGTVVKLGILRGSSTEAIIIEIKRAVIVINTVNYKIMDGNIGYIEITQFGDKTNEEFDKAMAYMKEKQVKEMIVDVRNNPGGYLSSAIHISDYFVDPGKVIVKVVYGDKTNQIYRGETEAYKTDLVVLVNEGSASASEIFSGAIQQNKAGTVMGDLTYGKGTVQNVIPLTNGGGMKLTVAEYFVANDYKVDQVGIKPDVKVDGVSLTQRALFNALIPMNEKIAQYKGNISLNVYGAQQRLNLLGYDLKADGIFGTKTQADIKQFQTTYGLKGTGVLDLKTVTKLDEVVNLYMKGEIDLQLNEAVRYLKAN